jgi:flagellar protein FlbB
MKKILIVIQVVILVLVFAKAASVLGLIRKSDLLPDASLITNHALAQQPAPVRVSASAPASNASLQSRPPKEPDYDNLSKQRDLAAALSAKKTELDNRENALRAEEQRLLTLRKEITDKIAFLKTNEEKLSTILESAHASEVKRYKEMAKVYEATPAAKAGSMIEKLDIKTAAGITMNMKKDKAGAIWGYITPQKAVEITKEITRVAGQQ